MFLKIGTTGFGGFMALIAQVQCYVVERKKLLTQDDMLNGISLATILPGPVAVNTVAYTGYRIRGWRGAVVAATAVMLPSFLLMLALTYAYFRWGQIPAAGKVFMGFIPAVAAVILAAAANMSLKTVKSAPEALIAVTGCLLLIMVRGFYITIAIIAISGLLGWILFGRGKETDKKALSDDLDINEPPKQAGISANAFAISVPVLGLKLVPVAKLFITFAGMSLLLFGGGYVFIPLMQHSVVDAYGWVTRKEFLDGIALGQIMPGPILISAAFIGYKVAGIGGAAAATAGMFAPSAVVMLICTRFLDGIKQSASITGALRGIRSGVLGMIVAACYVVARTAQPQIISLVIFAGALIALLRFKIETAWIIPAAGIIGFLAF